MSKLLQGHSTSFYHPQSISPSVQNRWKLTSCGYSDELSSNSCFIYLFSSSPSSMCRVFPPNNGKPKFHPYVGVLWCDCCRFLKFLLSQCPISGIQTHMGKFLEFCVFSHLLTWCSFLIFRYVMSSERKHCNSQVSYMFCLLKQWCSVGFREIMVFQKYPLIYWFPIYATYYFFSLWHCKLQERI